MSKLDSSDATMIVGSLNFAMDDRKARYLCPDGCGSDYNYKYIRRHLVEKHGWQHYDNENVYRLVEAGHDKE